MKPENLERPAETSAAARPTDSAKPERKGILLAHVVATKTANDTVHDEDVAYPENWQDEPRSEHQVGHKDQGRTVAVHSVAVLPAYRGMGLGKMLLKAYVQRIQHSGIADRIALLAHEDLIPFYENAGFENNGKSAAQFGGGNWNDMVCSFSNTVNFIPFTTF